MASSAHLSEATREMLVALSLLRLGSDTLVARWFNDLAWAAGQPAPDVPEIAACIVNELGADVDGRFELARGRAVQALARAHALGVNVITVLDSSYPDRLRKIADPPIAIWTRGLLDVSGPTVALVGSRRATPTGLGVSRRLSGELAAAGVLVVSGLARGIDGAAHRGALDAAGQTLAVLGNGPDVPYPHEHRDLMETIAATGMVVSEFPPGTRPEGRNFPLRNRIISGLSLAVVVVEASEKSGSLITARTALEQGRDVLAVPGSVASGTYKGCHALIKDGARLVETVDDILEEIGWTPPRSQGQVDKYIPVNDLDSLIPGTEPVSVDELAQKSGRPAAECLADLTLLEVSGRVARTTGGGFVKLDGPATYIERPGKREGSQP